MALASLFVNQNNNKLKVPERFEYQARNVYPILNEIQLFWSKIKVGKEINK